MKKLVIFLSMFFIGLAFLYEGYSYYSQENKEKTNQVTSKPIQNPTIEACLKRYETYEEFKEHFLESTDNCYIFSFRGGFFSTTPSVEDTVFQVSINGKTAGYDISKIPEATTFREVRKAFEAREKENVK